jgi:hypothetical protein
VFGLGAVQVGGAAPGYGLDRGVVVVDGDGVLVQDDTNLPDRAAPSFARQAFDTMISIAAGER